MYKLKKKLTNYNHCIPLEIWMHVFSYIKSPRQLLQCRLVCRRWDYPAETAMLSKDLEIYGGSAVKLYNHLAKKPGRTHLVRFIDVDVYREDSDMINLLKVSFNPKMRHFAAGLDPVGAEFFAAFLEIIKALPQDTVYSMRRIPEPAVLKDKNYARVAYTFRRTLQHLQISVECRAISTYLRRLRVFRNLIALTLDAESLDSVTNLDAILRNCPCLQELELTSPDNSSYVVKSHDTVLQWVNQSVTKVKSLVELTITFARPDLVEYLIYKYPNVSCLMCSGDRYQRDNATRVLAAVKDVRDFEVTYYFEHLQDIESSISTICSVDEKPTRIIAKVGYNPVEVGFNAEMQLKISNDEQRLIQVNVDLAYHLPSQVHLQVLENLGMCGSHCIVPHLEVNLLSLEPAADAGLMTFYDIVDRMPATERIDLFIERIMYNPIASWSINTERRLSQLVLRYAEVDPRVLVQISEMFPGLHSLTFYSCCILDSYPNDGQAQEKVFNIYMPYNNFSTLKLMAPTEGSYPYTGKPPQTRPMIEHNTISGYCYLQVSVLEVDVHMYCRLKAFSPPVFLTQQEFEARPYKADDATVYITCANLVSLHINLVGIDFDFKVKNYIFSSIRESLDDCTMELESGPQNYSLEDELYELDRLQKLQSNGQIWLTYRQNTDAVENKPFVFC